MEKWVDFYATIFPSRCDAETFVKSLEALLPEDHRHPAKIMMHQTQRLLSLSDDIPRIRPGKQSLQLLFLIICAEYIAKMHDNFKGEGKSKYYIHRFFDQFVDEADHRILANSFSRHDDTLMELHEVVDILYSVRCDVVHEGQYWDFNFCNGTPVFNTNPDVIVSISLADFRAIVARACIIAIKDYPFRINHGVQTIIDKRKG